MDNIEEKIVFNNENTNNDPKTAVNSLIDKGINIRLNEEMSQHCTYKVGGPADYFYLVDNLENLKDVLKWAKELNRHLSKEDIQMANRFTKKKNAQSH